MDYKRKKELERTKEVIKKMVTRSINLQLAQKMGLGMQKAISRASLGMISSASGNELPSNADEPTVEEL